MDALPPPLLPGVAEVRTGLCTLPPHLALEGVGGLILKPIPPWTCAELPKEGPCPLHSVKRLRVLTMPASFISFLLLGWPFTSVRTHDTAGFLTSEEPNPPPPPGLSKPEATTVCPVPGPPSAMQSLRAFSIPGNPTISSCCSSHPFARLASAKQACRTTSSDRLCKPARTLESRSEVSREANTRLMPSSSSAMLRRVLNACSCSSSSGSER